MDATKLTISPDTLRFQKMSHGKKTKLRRQNIIDLIQSKPYGTAITTSEFAAVTQTLPRSAHSLIRTMIKRGIISKDEISPRKYTYRVNGPITTRKLAIPAKPVMPVPPPAIPTTAAKRSVSDYAKEYYWETNDDSLHNFVAWMDQKELMLRREAAGG